MLSENLQTLRRLSGLSQEAIAEQIGVSRQALAKWENGETVPDVEKCQKLAQLYNVTLDDLVNHSQQDQGLPVPPKGKHLFGTVTVGDKGQIIIPKQARDLFHIQKGDRVILLGDESQGLALINEKHFMRMVEAIHDAGKE